jgi:hypothetical protein
MITVPPAYARVQNGRSSRQPDVTVAPTRGDAVQRECEGVQLESHRAPSPMRAVQLTNKPVQMTVEQSPRT